MFALCARHATRTTASTLSLPHHPSKPCDRIQGHLYSDWTRTEFPKESGVFIKGLERGELETASALVHKDFDKELEGQFEKLFYKKMVQFQFLQQEFLDPNIKEEYRRECLAEFKRCKHFERGMEVFAASKSAKELKDLFQKEVVIIQGCFQLRPILHEVIKVVPPPGVVACEVDVGKPILAEDVSDEMVSVAERTLQTAFQKVLFEIEKVSKTPIEREKKEFLWQIVSRERLQILKNRILFDVERIQDAEDPVALRKILCDKVSSKLLVEREKTAELERDVKRLWQVVDENPPASEFFHPFRVL